MTVQNDISLKKQSMKIPVKKRNLMKIRERKKVGESVKIRTKIIESAEKLFDDNF